MKVQTAFRIDEELLEAIKDKAKAQKRSLNNYIEYILHQVVGNVPNDQTKEAIEDARTNNNLQSVSNIDDFLNEI